MSYSQNYLGKDDPTRVAPASGRRWRGRLVSITGREDQGAGFPRFPYKAFFAAIALLSATITASAASSAQELNLELERAKTTAEIRLTGNMHAVEGSFAFKRGSIRYSPSSGAVTGEVVFDASSGKTGNDSRDHKMHKDVLESQRYSEIIFRPDHAMGAYSLRGKSTLQVHGMFAIHGTEHEVTFPVEVNADGSSWSATSSFEIPYAKWGMKNPSVLFLRVNSVVRVEFHAGGSLVQQ